MGRQLELEIKRSVIVKKNLIMNNKFLKTTFMYIYEESLQTIKMLLLFSANYFVINKEFHE